MVKTVLVVDDNPDVLFSIKEGLEEFKGKYAVISAASGEQCLALLETHQLPDLILLDIMMPGMSGWQLFDMLRENDSWKNIPVFFLTARTDKNAKNAGMFLADDYIEKPYEIKDLERRIDKVLKNRNQAQSLIP